MAEPTLESMTPDELAALKDAARAFDIARMKKIGSFHFAMVMGALTMWGAAETWAQSTGWALAQAVAIGNALVAGFIIPSTLHEWGHFTGARLSGSVSPVHDEAQNHFAMFEFKMDENDTKQFAWMSWGGILAPWVPVFIAAAVVPLSLTSGAVLFAALVSKAIATAAFEVPITLQALRTGEPGKALTESVVGGGLTRGRQIGQIAGIVCLAIVLISA